MFLRRLNTWPASERSSSFDELDRMKRQMDQLFGQLAGTRTTEQFAGVFPLFNVTEDKDNFYVRAELPGLKPDDIDISVTADSLSISGERKIESQAKDVQYHRREREAGTFSRIINLPGQIDTEKVEARNRNGILTITLGKAEATKPKQISIKAS